MQFFKEIFRFFEIFLKFYRNFRHTFWKNFDNFEYMDLWGVLGAEPPNIAKIGRKINGTLPNFEVFHESLANFDLNKLILIKIKATNLEF